MSGPARNSGPVLLAPLTVEWLAVWRPRGRGPVSRRTGMGPGRSRRAALPAGGDPVAVVGLAGGLAEQVRSGDVVVAERVRDAGPARAAEQGAIELTSAGPLADRLRRLGLIVHVGTLLSSEHLVTGAERARLAETGALAVDLESGPLLRRLAAAGPRPLAAVRVVVDTAREPLARPGTVLRALRALRVLHRTVPAIASWAAYDAARPGTPGAGPTPGPGAPEAGMDDPIVDPSGV